MTTPEDKPKSRQALEAEGWKLSSTSSGAHLQRVLEMYRELGLEVYLETAKPEECAGCTDCYVAGGETVTRIYTRGREG